MRKNLFSNLIKGGLLVAASVLAQGASASEMTVSAKFDHAYNLTVQGCNAYWTYYAGAEGLYGQDQWGGCMGRNNVQVYAEAPARIDYLELPSSFNNYTLKALVVEPSGGANQVYVHIYSDDGYDQPYPQPYPNPYPQPYPDRYPRHEPPRHEPPNRPDGGNNNGGGGGRGNGGGHRPGADSSSQELIFQQ